MLNNKPFNGDDNITKEFQKLVNTYGIKTIIETGTYEADTTFELLNMVPNVYSIEVNKSYYDKVQNNLTNEQKKSVNFILGSSPESIKKIITSNVKMPILFFLDAHWYDFNPLIDELKVIAEMNIDDCVIAIHDFKVPNKDFGFDKFPDGKDYCWENIKEYIQNIYGENFVFYYNEIASGAYRGIIYICPLKT